METFHAWPPKAHGHLTVRNAFSLTSRVPKVLTVSILLRHTCSKSLLKVKVVSQLWVPITLKRDSYTSNIQWHRIGITTPKGRNESVDGTKARTSGQKLIPLAPCLTLRLWCQVWVAHPLKLCHLQPTWLLELPPLGVCTLPWQMTHVHLQHPEISTPASALPSELHAWSSGVPAEKLILLLIAWPHRLFSGMLVEACMAL